MAATRRILARLALSRSWEKRGSRIESPGFRRTLRACTTGERRGPRAPLDFSPPPRPASCCFQHRGTGRPPWAPDSELCGRCIPFSFHAAAPIPFRCPQTSETGVAPGGVSAASAWPASLPPPMRVCPAWRAAGALRLAACPLTRASLRRHPVGTPRTAEPRPAGPVSPPANPASLPGATSRRWPAPLAPDSRL